MTKALLALGAAAVAAVATRRIAANLIPTNVLLRSNHRGIKVPTGLGIAVLAGFSAGMAFVGFVRAVAPRAPSASVALLGSFALLIAGFGFGLLGLFDDFTAQPERGWRSHLPALARGRLTPGALKIVGGGTLAFIIGSIGSSSFGWALVDAAIIALTANLFNSLDVRPGRAVKFYLVAVVPLAILSPSLTVPLAATLGAVGAFGVFDLSERAMLGDAGSNAIGAILGVSVVASEPPSWFVLSLLGLLAGLTAVAEGPSLSAWIDRIGPLRAFDRAWRVAEPTEILGVSGVADRNAGGRGGELLH